MKNYWLVMGKCVMWFFYDYDWFLVLLNSFCIMVCWCYLWGVLVIVFDECIVKMEYVLMDF